MPIAQSKHRTREAALAGRAAASAPHSTQLRLFLAQACAAAARAGSQAQRDAWAHAASPRTAPQMNASVVMKPRSHRSQPSDRYALTEGRTECRIDQRSARVGPKQPMHAALRLCHHVTCRASPRVLLQVRGCARMQPAVVSVSEASTTRWLRLNTIKYTDEKGAERLWDACERTTRKAEASADGTECALAQRTAHKLLCSRGYPRSAETPRRGAAHAAGEAVPPAGAC